MYDFLSEALEEFPEVDDDTGEKKEDTVKRYSALLRKEKLSSEKTLPMLNRDMLQGLIPRGHAFAIELKAKKYGKSDLHKVSA